MSVPGRNPENFTMDVINAHMDAKGRGDKPAMAALLADDVIMESPKGTIQGKDKLMEAAK